MLAQPVVGRCRLCTTNDLEALIEDLAIELWEGQLAGSSYERPWANAGPAWQLEFRRFARSTIAVLQHQH